jgi:hypothetical protein
MLQIRHVGAADHSGPPTGRSVTKSDHRVLVAPRG